MRRITHSHIKSRRHRPSSRTRTVCIVDPQVDDYQGWDLLAKASAVRLTLCATAEEALRQSRTQMTDLWVINAELPELSGHELCSMLKARSPAVPVYLVTDQYAPTVEHAAIASRATVFCVKPAHSAAFGLWLERQQRTSDFAHADVAATDRCSTRYVSDLVHTG